MIKRIFLIVLDSFGVGAAPDADKWGDNGSDTLGAIRSHPEFDCPTLASLGLFHIDGVCGGIGLPQAAYGRMREQSNGKDTTIGHWEIAGLVSDEPLPTYPDGFPDEIIDEFARRTGHKVLCNKPYSGTDVIRDYGREAVDSGALIVYTSADSVFQVAAHEAVVPVDELYRCCEIAREMLTGHHGVGRVIARPFEGEWPYVRTSRRHDFSLVPPRDTMLDRLSEAGRDVVTVGKIYDIFAGKGIPASECRRTEGNDHGMRLTSELLDRDFRGLCFVNLVDFDSAYGHRNDVAGYARAMTAFDRWLSDFVPRLGEDDVLMITADHGCDPSTPSTDHSREYTPLLVYGKRIRAGYALGTRQSFADISATVLEALGAEQGSTAGQSFWKDIYAGDAESPFTVGGKLKKKAQKALMQAASAAREGAYAPYSNFKVGAALITKTGKVYTGCNIENAAYSPTNCAERTAVFKAVSEGERDFAAIAVVGGPEEGPAPFCAPCGVCRQVLAEFCAPDMPVLLGTPSQFTAYRLDELLPASFGGKDLGK